MSTSKVHVTETRVLEILSAYGANPQRWPSAERNHISQFLDTNSHLLDVLDIQRELDNSIAREHQQILASIPNVDRISTTILRSVEPVIKGKIMDSTYILALAASMLLVVASVISYTPVEESVNAPNPVFEQWAWIEITDEVLVPESSLEQVTMMELIELEVSELDGI